MVPITCQRQIKLPVSLFLLTAVSLMVMVRCGDDNDFKERYLVKFTNIGTHEITEISLSMYGSEETVSVSKLASRESSEYQSFLLPRISKTDMPNGWGEYSGVYTQQDTLKTIYIFNDEHDFRDEVIIEIANSSYFVIYPTAQ